MFENIDNRTIILGDDLKKELKENSKVRIAASCFSMYAFSELKEELSKIKELEFIFTSPTFTKDAISDNIKKEKREFYIPKQNRENSLYGSEFEIKLRNKMSLKAVAKECAEWVKEKVQFKSNKTNSTMPNFIGIKTSDEKMINYMPINGFTTTDLGYNQGNNLFTAITKSDMAEQSKYLFTMFDEIWNDESKLEDVTQRIVDFIGTAYQENSPEFIYFIILYNIFSDYLSDITDDKMPNEATGFKNSLIWQKMYNFQRDGVVGIINKLEKYNGCILADSVGLGKTFTALGVIHYYDLKNKSVLVLCPKRLADNWNDYKGNTKTNIFYQDKIRYDVLYHTDLGRTKGYSNGINLGTINWGNYDLVVIDESHNFRNDNVKKDHETRYDFLMNHVMKEGVKTKVLMLSATPVNNRYNDLRNQLSLAYCGNFSELDETLNINKKVVNIFRRAQQVFNKWSKLPVKDRKTSDLLEQLDVDFTLLLDSVTIARSRKHIQKYYDTSDIGTFPKRLPSISVNCKLTERTDVKPLKELYELLDKLNLNMYAPANAILPSRKYKYESLNKKITDNFISEIANRENGLKRLMKINLLKRLESSVYSLRLTINRMIKHCEKLLNNISDFRNGKEEFFDKTVHDYVDYDRDEEGKYCPQEIDVGKDVKISYEDIDITGWEHDIVCDLNIFKKIYNELQKVSVEDDYKLNKLKEMIDNKIKKPINPNNKKVIVFSAFADTAEYLYTNLKDYMKEKYHIETACITGGEKGNKCTVDISPNTNELLTLFSPLSKSKNLTMPDIDAEIDLLIATDCVSEGQNLQDCDFCLNYDIHWNPVRIVQRFGRIDRIGSKNTKIQLVNFWPDIDLDQYIHLNNRVSARMAILDGTATGDSNILEDNQEDMEFRQKQWEQLKNGEIIDLEDIDGNITITDLGINDFKMDVANFIKINGIPKNIPKGMHAVVNANKEKGVVPGVVFVMKNINNSVNFNKQNRLHPYYLVYVDKNGDVVNNHLQVKAILDVLRATCKNQFEPIKSAYEPFNKETEDGLKMDKYNKLLSDGIHSIVEVKEESDLDALFKQGSEVLTSNKIKGLDDFELLAFVVIK